MMSYTAKITSTLMTSYLVNPYRLSFYNLGPVVKKFENHC